MTAIKISICDDALNHTEPMIDESSPTNSDFLNMTHGKAVQERWRLLLLQESLLSHLDLIVSDAGFSQSTLEYLRALPDRIVKLKNKCALQETDSKPKSSLTPLTKCTRNS